MVFRQWTLRSGAMYVFLNLSCDNFKNTLLAPLLKVNSLTVNFFYKIISYGYDQNSKEFQYSFYPLFEVQKTFFQVAFFLKFWPYV